MQGAPLCFSGPQTAARKSHPAVSSVRGYGISELRVLPDEQLMVHVKAGRYEALGVLFDRYRRLILSVGFKILRDPGEAEDLAQSVFLEVYRVAGQFNAARGSAKTWLLQYAYHRSINRRKYLLRRDFYGAGDFEEASNKNALERASAEGAFASVDARKMLGAILPELSTAQRRTIEMVYFDGLTFEEISEKTSRSIVSVRHHYHRGLRRLRELLTRKARLQGTGYRAEGASKSKRGKNGEE
jgi:RNA polymerase sigma-70 factor, ECF subfamily